ncbi:MAG: hypothetical protein IJ733_15990, partial [Lachnospiraceae bacterium]|nr:hypothetical protein [Lachnospiraceae bacterium]
MQVKHRYIWIFGGLSVLYLLLMIVVGKFDLQTSDPEEQEEVYTIAREKEDSDLSYQISEREGENGTVHTESGGSSLYEGNHTTEPGKTMEPESTMVPESAVNPEIVMNPEGTMELESTMDPESTMNPEKTLNPESTSAPAAAESAESTLDSKTASAPQKETAKPKAAKKPLFYGYKNISKERQRVVKLAKKYVGKISYYWGGKPSGKEIQGKTDPHKLDCSGFIQFIYSKVKGKRVASVGATITISTLEKIRREALKPGDIGLKRGTGSLYFDADGKAYPEPGLAEVSNQRRVKNARKRIAVLEDKILTVNAALEEKQEKIREWKERKLSILKRARK